ncbi:short-chain dehydrogenase/reductase [Rhodococcus sp. WMMA185]|uniref:oxidoreductase n=1 Tax=Rhodococcus sp. WMMA185 TaxID=679318 RepID=UPI0008782457|nr:oxidoreductase [Rhodococcus sp. WMMA185]AOW94110.1 short-chain dehydrogenase/reductase [Rhodococcus sp. WMMA185]
MATWFITGCSTGLGRALAEAVLARGHNAVVTARDTTTLAELAATYPDKALTLPLDVTDPDQIVEAVRQARSRFGGIDVLVNNAGYGYRAAVEEGVDAEVERLFATNFFGAVGTIKAALPDMRARRSGAIVNISSIGARISPVGSGYYSATKAALEGMSGSLRKELHPFGISVTVVEPGSFRTDFAGRSLAQPAEAIADYSETVGKRRKENDTTHGTQPGDPAEAAQAIIAAVEDPNPPFMLLLGKDALARYFEVEEAQRADVEKWRELTIGTDFAVT